MRVGIETAGKLEGDLLARETALGIAENTMRSSNPEILRLQSEIQEIRRQLTDMQRGSDSGNGDGLDRSLESLPELGKQYAYLLREVTIQERLYELLIEQLYQARIKETETMPVVQVLDEASVPVYKKSLPVAKAGILAALLGFLLGVFLVQAEEWWRRYEWRQADAVGLSRLWRNLPRRSQDG